MEKMYEDEHYAIHKAEPQTIVVEGRASYADAETLAYWLKDYGKTDCDGDHCDQAACHWSAKTEILWGRVLGPMFFGNPKVSSEHIAQRFLIPLSIIEVERESYLSYNMDGVEWFPDLRFLDNEYIVNR